jgi:MoxR-like ATPase
MDRFLLRVRMGYPEGAEERRLVAERGGGDLVADLRPVTTLTEIRALAERVDRVRVDEALLDYLMTVVIETRRSALLSLGVSPRGAISWYRAAKAHALVDGRDFCVPDDLKRLALPALAHRVVLASSHESLSRTRDEAERVIAEILERVPIPE